MIVYWSSTQQTCELQSQERIRGFTTKAIKFFKESKNRKTHCATMRKTKERKRLLNKLREFTSLPSFTMQSIDIIIKASTVHWRGQLLRIIRLSSQMRLPLRRRGPRISCTCQTYMFRFTQVKLTYMLLIIYKISISCLQRTR